MVKSIFISTILISIFSLSSKGQTGSAKQVKWTTTVNKTGDKQYEVRFTATISGDFHIYSQIAGVEDAFPTTISYTPNPLLTVKDKATEVGKKVTKIEEVFGGKVNFYEKTVTFVQIVKGKTKAKTSLNGKIEFMVCDESLCLPPADFSFKIPIDG